MMKRANIPQDDTPLSSVTEPPASQVPGTESNPNPSKKRKTGATQQRLSSFLERPMTDDEKQKADIRFLRFLVHCNIPFRATESPFLAELIKQLRPSYNVPSRYLLSNSILPGEAARVQLSNMEALKGRKLLTVMTDGWDDLLHRSLYGTLAAERSCFPVILGLEDVTGKRGSAETIQDVVENGMLRMNLDPKQLIGLVTDDPSVMTAVRRNFETKYPWVITLPCFLHKLNGIVGKISSYPAFKSVISANNKIVTFFTSSHYWGGQLKALAIQQKVTRGLKSNTETRWYSLILLCVSVLEHRTALEMLCRRPDALRKTNGLSPVSSDVVATVRNGAHWDHTAQLVRFCKPVVDAIGKIESRDASLADCMLELLRCARDLSEINYELGDDNNFTFHAIATFNREFGKLNTDIHFLALYLHPQCRRLAVSEVHKSRSFVQICEIAGNLAKKLQFTALAAEKLVRDLQLYHKCQPPFTGGLVDGAEWWEMLPIDVVNHPLKAVAKIIFSLVPHSAEVERFFSDLGGIQSPKRCNLSVETFEMLGMLRNHYVALTQSRAQALGLSYRRSHGHSRVAGIDLTLVNRLENTNERDIEEAVVAQVEMEEREALHAEMNETITLEDIDKAFDALERETAAELEPDLTVEGNEITVGAVYSLKELKKVDEGEVPRAVEDDLTVLRGDLATWTVLDILTKTGVRS